MFDVRQIRWRLFYSDGRVYDGDCAEHAFWAPTLGVQIMKEERAIADDPMGYSIRHGCIAFCWESIPVARWSGKSDQRGIDDYFFHTDGPQKKLIGREIYDGTYQDIIKRAREEGAFDNFDFRPGEVTE